MSAIRSILAEAIDKVNAAQPAAVADDVLLADETTDAGGNAALDAALRATKNLILPCDLVTSTAGRMGRSAAPIRQVPAVAWDMCFASRAWRRSEPLRAAEEIAGGRSAGRSRSKTFAAVRMAAPITNGARRSRGRRSLHSGARRRWNADVDSLRARRRSGSLRALDRSESAICCAERPCSSALRRWAQGIGR